MDQIKKLLWFDLEMTGLDPCHDHILEVACIVSDLEWVHLERFHRIVFQTTEIIAQMDHWCQKTHQESGLLASIPSGTPLQQVELELTSLLNRHWKSEEKIRLAGNSIANDRHFIEVHLPEVAKRLHYRMIDVSSFKEIFREKFGIQFKKKNAHRALSDIAESIEELKTYLSYVHIGP